ncbi:protein-L-isoaspartate(D-aspartate) O-methyltransferase [Microbacterium sp. APC 3898]|uniref:Protein-L-isoaspartate O-methyltransferase n=1 Tax=Planococcus notacanthi TaxID=3035188 RepID=A0ABT7ZKD7_9BACL|nr:MULTISPECIES: protein-L-isoaspartate(D-aspartate) O-methyltransferase [Terrabacteria group]MDN3427615.1 protein-L-isoaspartate(D-aspartate) O-methyltransferase [Planococcus sp. APC 4016]MDN3499166.1 protein-L-isoaspartate(D-aspartate) O-methyltransferase [Microbacterium sp. APC 3898]
MKSQRKEIISYFKQMDRSFFMDSNKDLAVFDQALPIGFEQTISQPSLVLEMTLALDLHPEQKVLELGTGSGFQTALLAAFSESVYTIERIEELHARAKERLAQLNFQNIHFKLGDGSEGWKEFAPYDRIMVTAAAAEVPKELLEQLEIGGKMVIPVGSSFSQELRLIEKDDQGKTHTTLLNEVLFVPLKGKYEK